jgi:hypothetical protein
MLLEEKAEGEEEGEKEVEEEEPYAKWRIRSSKSMSGSAVESTGERWVKIGERRGNTIPELRCCSDLCLKKTKEKDIRVSFKLSVRELSGELFDVKPLRVG